MAKKSKAVRRSSEHAMPARPSKATHELAALIIRFAIGIVFVVHGAQKLFSFGIDGFTQFMAGLGVPAPGLFAVLVIALEFGGGILLLLGLFTRWVALLLAINMFFAWLLVHAPNGFFITQGAIGYEFVLTLMLVCIGIFFHGAGLFSLERALFGREL